MGRCRPDPYHGMHGYHAGEIRTPEDDRAITLREAARLQTFPDNYKFDGNPSQIATQIGNAVPINLVEALAPALRCALRHGNSTG